MDETQKCKIVERDGDIQVFVKPDIIPMSLEGKLSSDDINKGTGMVDDIMNLHSLKNSLYRQCSGLPCSESCKSPFKAIPNGNPKADIMFINKMPTEYESCMMCSHCDTDSVFLSLIIGRINMTRNDVYCTDMIKCSNATLDEQSFRTCIDNYLMKEIKYVQPKIILCNGISILKTWAKLGYIEGLPEDIVYGNIYDVTISNISLKIMAIFDLDKVLQKQGQELAECKGKLWIQILSAYNAIEKITLEREQKVMKLIDEYSEKHPMAKECGEEYIYQNDNAQVDGLQLVSDIFNLYVGENVKEKN